MWGGGGGGGGTRLVLYEGQRERPHVAVQVPHALPGQKGGAPEVGAQVLLRHPPPRQHLQPDRLLPCVPPPAD